MNFENLNLVSLDEKEQTQINGGSILAAIAAVAAVGTLCIAAWAFCYQIGKD